jgi:hypothetical protein
VSEIVERVAFAMAAENSRQIDEEGEGATWMELARAAIKAMGRPTEQMIGAVGNDEARRWAHGVWLLMSEAALRDSDAGSAEDAGTAAEPRSGGSAGPSRASPEHDHHTQTKG